jgi:predicted adenylyl cyclase CyaB
MDSTWPFGEPEETEVITLERILRGESSVLLVTHDEEDGAWQFLDGEHVFEDDGAVVRLGEMVQFDPSLGPLGDLPAGWYAWRPSPGRPWQRAAGEPPVTPDRRHDEAATGHPGATNIEIKARVADLDRLRASAESISDTAVEVLDQEDIFFAAPEGRLKLRIRGEHSGELIHYHRADTAEPKASRYLIAPTSSPAALKEILSRVLPLAGVVRKRRWLYLVGQTRIHLDRVEGLGDFVELEVVLLPDQDQKEGVAIAEDLMSRLGIAPEQLIKEAYIDLLNDRGWGEIQDSVTIPNGGG